MQFERKELGFSHPYNPLSKMNYTPINPLYEIPLKESYFKKVTAPVYDVLRKELKQVFKNRSCNFKNDLFFKDTTGKNRIGQKVKRQNQKWIRGEGRLMDNTPAGDYIKGSSHAWRNAFSQLP